jgi:hypothetical protein
LYISPNIIVIKSGKMIWTGHAARLGEIDVFNILVGKSKRKGPLSRHRHRYGDNIKIDIENGV